MRILITDDSSTLPASVQDMFARAPVGKSAATTPSVGSVILAFTGGAAGAAAAPSKVASAVSSAEGCRPARRAACTISRSCSPPFSMRSAWRC
jgi:hypothetical protein